MTLRPPRSPLFPYTTLFRSDRVRVWVEDEGPGIPPQERERVWLPFLRLQRDRNGATGGSGIGLAVVRELALLHGGETWVEDRKSTRLNSSHANISYAVFCLK